MKVLTLFIALSLTPIAFAEEANLTRREAFLQLWESIRRPAYETRSSFADVPEGAVGHLEISYAENRGLLEEEEAFRPDEPVRLGDALLWLYRTRNVREVDEMKPEHLESLMEEFPLGDATLSLDGRVTREQLTTLMVELDTMLAKEVHQISFYGEKFHGHGTAFGETFDMHALTAAHRTYPGNTLVRVRNVANGESVVVRVNDRGPYVEGRDMDLSLEAFARIGKHSEGVAYVTFERLGDAELVDPCEQKEPVYQKRVSKDVHFFRGIPHAFSLGTQLVLQSSKVFVIQSIRFPDGQELRIQDFVHPGEKYRFSPDSAGTHIFMVGNALGTIREMKMKVNAC